MLRKKKSVGLTRKASVPAVASEVLENSVPAVEKSVEAAGPTSANPIGKRKRSDAAVEKTTADAIEGDAVASPLLSPPSVGDTATDHQPVACIKDTARVLGDNSLNKQKPRVSSAPIRLSRAVAQLGHRNGDESLWLARATSTPVGRGSRKARACMFCQSKLTGSWHDMSLGCFSSEMAPTSGVMCDRCVIPLRSLQTHEFARAMREVS